MAVLAFVAVSAAQADAPTGDFSISDSAPNVGEAVTFTASGLSDPDGGSSFDVTWRFGDGGRGSGTSVSHAYTSPGTKDVTMHVVDDDGESADVSHAVRVNAPPTANFTFAALDRVAGQPFNVPLLNQRVAFSANSSTDSDGTIASYAWDFNGDGQFDPGPASTIAALTTPGTVNVGLQVTDSDGATSTFTQPIRVDQAPAASFTYAPTEPLTSDRVQFASTSVDPDGSGDISSTRWDLDGDGQVDDATGAAASRVYPTPAMYHVGLLVTDSVGVQSFQQQDVLVTAPGQPREGGGSGGQPATQIPGATPAAPGGAPGTASSPLPGAPPGPRRSVIAGVRVSIAGSIAGSGTRITRLRVAAPAGALIIGDCTGRGCPAKPERHRTRKATVVRLGKLERRFAAGARIVVSVTKPGVIGKRVQFTIRPGKPPLRRELCLVPGAQRASRCPRS